MARVQWYDADPSDMNRKIVRRNRGVGTSTLAKAGEIHAIAEVLMAPHHANSAARRERRGTKDLPSTITVEPGSGGVDAFVSINAESQVAAASIEVETGVLRAAMGLV